jgi:hypothetical protein
MQPIEEQMRRELVRVSFDLERPKPALAWEAFKAYLTRGIVGQKTLMTGFSCYHDADRDQTLWLEFARRLADEVTGVGRNCGCGFSRTVPGDLIGVDKGNWWWAEDSTLEEWLGEVESMAEFKCCLALEDWRFEGYSL